MRTNDRSSTVARKNGRYLPTPALALADAPNSSPIFVRVRKTAAAQTAEMTKAVK